MVPGRGREHTSCLSLLAVSRASRRSATHDAIGDETTSPTVTAKPGQPRRPRDSTDAKPDPTRKASQVNQRLEVIMSTTDVRAETSSEYAPRRSHEARGRHVPVSDVDRAKRFDESLDGVETAISPSARTSVPATHAARLAVRDHLRQRGHDGHAGSLQDLMLVVDDIDAAGDPTHQPWHRRERGRPLRDPTLRQRRDRSARAGVDPQGRAFHVGFLQRSGRERLAAPRDQDQAPGARVGRVTHGRCDFADRVHETGAHHDRYDKTHGAHNSWDWDPADMHGTEREARRHRAANAHEQDVLRVLPR